MSKILQKSGRLLVILTIGILSPFCLSAYYDEPQCYKEIQTHFFQSDLVGQALSLYSKTIYQNQWGLITRRLQERSKNIPAILKSRAASMERNPLEYPFEPDIAAALLQEVLLQQFKQVLSESNFTNERAIKDMFAYIRRGQSEKFKACLGEEVDAQ